MSSKATYYRSQREVLWRQKRPNTEAKETYYRGNRSHINCSEYVIIKIGLLWRQKRPSMEAASCVYLTIRLEKSESWDLGFRVQGIVQFRVQGLGFRV